MDRWWMSLGIGSWVAIALLMLFVTVVVWVIIRLYPAGAPPAPRGVETHPTTDDVAPPSCGVAPLLGQARGRRR